MAANDSMPCSAEEKAWAAIAHSEFSKGNYDSCLTYLNKILARRPNDVKVRHNKAVAIFYQSKQRKVKDLNDELNSMCNQVNLRTNNLEALDHMEHPSLLYNKAVLLYHNYQYQTSLVIIQKLWQFFESLPDDLARKVAVLMLELLLRTDQAEKAFNIIQYLEKLYYQNSNDDDEEEAVSKDEIVDPFKKKLTYFKAKALLLLKSTKGCKREIKLLVNYGESASAIYLRSQLEYLRGNFSKAIKVLNTSICATNKQLMSTKFEETGDMYLVLYYMNLAILHLKIDKPHIACLYNHMAQTEHLNTFEKLKKEAKDNLVLCIHNISLQYKIKYNSAICLLQTERPAEAFEYFQQASNFFNTNPKIWLYLAECCIQNNIPDNSHYFNIKTCKNMLAKGQVGSGANRKIILTPPQLQKTSLESSAIPNPTLEFASICLKNAYLLLGPKTKENNSLHNDVLAVSSYVALCIGDMYSSAVHTEKLLSHSKLTGVHKFLAALYKTEALIQKNDVAGALKVLEQYTLTSFEPPTTWFPNNVSTAQVILCYNKAMLYSLLGELEKSSDLLKQIGISNDLSAKEYPIQGIILSIYINLKQGQGELAKQTIKQFLPQYNK